MGECPPQIWYRFGPRHYIRGWDQYSFYYIQRFSSELGRLLVLRVSGIESAIMIWNSVFHNELVVFTLVRERDIHYFIFFSPVEHVWLLQIALRFILHNGWWGWGWWWFLLLWGILQLVLNTGSLQHCSDIVLLGFKKVQFNVASWCLRMAYSRSSRLEFSFFF